ncbi:MAG: hypothetical protein ABI416_09535 [Ginsengibacter sp.]
MKSYDPHYATMSSALIKDRRLSPCMFDKEHKLNGCGMEMKSTVMALCMGPVPDLKRQPRLSLNNELTVTVPRKYLRRKLVPSIYRQSHATSNTKNY